MTDAAPTDREPRTEAGRQLLHEIEMFGYDAYDAGRAAFGSWEKAIATIEAESVAAMRSALEAEWYNGNLDESAYDRILESTLTLEDAA